MSDKKVSIGHVDLGKGLPCLLVAEIGLNHNGSLSLAHQLIDVAAESGASMVKFQKRSPKDLATAEFLKAPFAKAPLFGRTQEEVRRRLEFSQPQMKELAEHAKELNLLFSFTAFDLPSLKVATDLRLPVLKIASHSMTNGPLLNAMAATKLPIIASTGGVTWDELDKAVATLKSSPLILLHCASAYPCPDNLVFLDTITELQKRFGCPVGYSGHEAGIDLSIAAATLGAVLIERHFTINRAMVGLDHGISLEPLEFSAMASSIRRIEKARGVSSGILPEELPSRLNYHVAIRVNRAVQPGEVLRETDLICKQPLRDDKLFFTGLEIGKVIGEKLKVALAPEDAIPRSAVE